MIQLHGHESIERVEAVRALCGKPVIKAVSVGSASDVDKAMQAINDATKALMEARAALWKQKDESKAAREQAKSKGKPTKPSGGLPGERKPVRK